MLSCIETVELIEIPVGVWSWMRPKNHVWWGLACTAMWSLVKNLRQFYYVLNCARIIFFLINLFYCYILHFIFCWLFLLFVWCCSLFITESWCGLMGTPNVVWSSCVCLLNTTMSHAKTDEPSRCYLGCGIELAQATMPCPSRPVQRGLCVCCVYTTVSYEKTDKPSRCHVGCDIGYKCPFLLCSRWRAYVELYRNGWPDRDTGWGVELDASKESCLVGVSTHGHVVFG